MVLFTEANGKMKTDTVMVFKFGQMVQSMKAFGKITKLMERASFGMQTEMFLMANGKMIRLMVTEYTLMLMERSMKGSGLMIYNTEKDLRFGLMAHAMMVNTKKA